MSILERLQAYVDTAMTKMIERGQHKAALYLIALPFMLVFLIAGAAPGPACAAALGLGFTLLFPRVKGLQVTLRDRRMLLALGGALLALAAGVQTVLWIRGPQAATTSFSLLLIPLLAVLALVLTWWMLVRL